MVDIRQFFGNSKRSSSAANNCSSNDPPEQRSTSKRMKKSTKAEPTKLEQPSNDSSNYIEVDSDGAEPVKVQEKSESKRQKTKSPVKKDKKIKVEPKEQIHELKENLTAEEILAQIPDASLPDVSDLKGKPYMFFQQRKTEGPQSSGAPIEIAEAKENCLTGLNIIFTGVLPNLDRTMAEGLAKKYGAKVTKSISGKTSLVVLGEDAGPSKIEKVKKLNIKAIDEAGFISLLNKMPADGGSGERAIQAKHKREKEENAIIEEAEKQEISSQKDQVPTTQSATQSVDIPDSQKLWTVKYAPKDLNQLCGNKGQISKLKNWLENWFTNSKNDFKDPGKDGSGIFRACLISGPPGIGKTSAAHLIARSLGYDVLEKNASDVRSKSLLNSEIKSMLNNTSVMGFLKHRKDSPDDPNPNSKNFCIIMDEVDGMSSGDHGGAGALSAFCKITKMPLILICNDKSLPKMRTFDRVTFDLPFRRPTETEVKARLMTIAHREKVKLDPTIISQLVQITNNDIRQMINILSTVSKTRKTIGHEDTGEITVNWKKQTNLKAFDITGRLFSSQIYNPGANHSLNDKIDLYFNDIDLTPLMIQENYIYTKPARSTSTLDHLERVANAADDISQSDKINSMIRSSDQQWSLLPFHAIMSSVSPAMRVAGNFTQRINFASWLGQNSKTMKYNRLLLELYYHTVSRTLTNKIQLRLQYMPLFSKKLMMPLLLEGENGIPHIINIMDHYFMTREDWDSILEYGVGPGKADAFLKKIPTKVKTAFTRKYNSTSHPIAIYRSGNSIGNSVTKKSKIDYEDVVEDDLDDQPDEPEEDPDLIDAKKDKLIKEVKPKKTNPKKGTNKKLKTKK